LSGTIGSALDWIDRTCSHVVRGAAAGPHLLVPLFHAVASDAAAAGSVLAPDQAVSLEDMRRFLDAVLTAGYLPISLPQLEAGLPQDGKYVLVTFDDGYFNNASALPVLEEFAVPAAFFISSGHVQRSRAFWWDVAARAWRRRGATDREVQAALERLKQRTAAELEHELVRELGPGAFEPVSDLDRPFSASELRDVARHPLVALGNHTADHTILTRCSPACAESAIGEGRRGIESMTGVTPLAIAYPDGAFSPEVAAAALRTGHRLGFTCVPKSNPAPLAEESRMFIGRHIIRGGRDYTRDLTWLSAATARRAPSRSRAPAARAGLGRPVAVRRPVRRAPVGCALRAPPSPTVRTLCAPYEDSAPARLDAPS
jgi:peptidoglycan/xylan/chitin deacetylase (PgdA/CDA1 family)